MDKRAGIILILVGLAVMASSLYSYSSTASQVYTAFTSEPSECNGTAFGVNLANLESRGKGSLVAYFEGNKSVEVLENFTWRLSVLNDPCRDGYAEVRLTTSNGEDIHTNTTIENLYSILAAPLDLLALYAQQSGVVSSLGPASGYRVDLQPQIITGPVNGTYYLGFTTYYYHGSTGLLMKIESHRVLSYGNATGAPKLMLLKMEVNDYSYQRGGETASYRESLDIATAASFLYGLYFILGLVITLYGLGKLASLL